MNHIKSKPKAPAAAPAPGAAGGAHQTMYAMFHADTPPPMATRPAA